MVVPFILHPLYQYPLFYKQVLRVSHLGMKILFE